MSLVVRAWGLIIQLTYFSVGCLRTRQLASFQVLFIQSVCLCLLLFSYSVLSELACQLVVVQVLHPM